MYQIRDINKIIILLNDDVYGKNYKLFIPKNHNLLTNSKYITEPIKFYLKTLYAYVDIPITILSVHKFQQEYNSYIQSRYLYYPHPDMNVLPSVLSFANEHHTFVFTDVKDQNKALGIKKMFSSKNISVALGDVDYYYEGNWRSVNLGIFTLAALLQCEKEFGLGTVPSMIRLLGQIRVNTHYNTHLFTTLDYTHGYRIPRIVPCASGEFNDFGTTIILNAFYKLAHMYAQDEVKVCFQKLKAFARELLLKQNCTAFDCTLHDKIIEVEFQRTKKLKKYQFSLNLNQYTLSPKLWNCESLPLHNVKTTL